MCCEGEKAKVLLELTVQVLFGLSVSFNTKFFFLNIFLCILRLKGRKDSFVINLYTGSV